MDYRTLGRTGLSVPVLGFGALEIGRNWPYWRKEKDDFSKPSEADAVNVIHAAIDAGINFFDTAPAYHHSEEILGKAFKGKRKEIIIATKCGEWFDGNNSVYNYSYSETLKFVENSLRLLQTDYMDILQIHSASTEVIKNGETIAAMKEAQRQGKVRFLGLSTEYEETSVLAIESGDFDTIQISYNAMNLAMAKNVFPKAVERSVGIIIKDGMARGKLSQKYTEVESAEEKTIILKLNDIAAASGMTIAELAVRFVRSNPSVNSIIIGTKNLHHLQSNLESIHRGPLPEKIVRSIMEVNA
jgi:aryl-alcohol dehydrogenase-like predicted oxidoreductase